MDVIKRIIAHILYIIGISFIFIGTWCVGAFFMNSAFGAAIAGLIAFGVTGVVMAYVYPWVFGKPNPIEESETIE